MRNTKHTPGPWKVYPSYFNDGLHEQLFVLDEKKDVIAKMGTVEAETANAKLIAAAPEMYEAAEKLISFCNAVGGQFMFSEELKAMKAAIKKATE